MIAVIDTSAFLRLFIPDGPIPEGLVEFFRRVAQGRHAALAPELLLAEAANVVNKKRLNHELTNEDAVELIELIQRMPIHLVSHKNLLSSSAELAKVQNLTVYDALFLALAKQKSAVLFTADAKLARSARSLGLAPFDVMAL